MKDRSYSEAQELYGKLRGLYASPYPDTESERISSTQILKDAKYSDDFIIAKMKILLRISSETYKTKLHLLIQSEFWSNKYQQQQ